MFGFDEGNIMGIEFSGNSSDHSVGEFRRRRRPLGIGIAATAAMALFLGGMGATASAAPGDTADDTVNVSVSVADTLDLTITSTNFNLPGPAGAVVGLPDAVAYTVTTNNLGGYVVTVAAAADVLTGASTVDGTDTIPVSALTVQQDEAIDDQPQVMTGPTDAAPVELVTSLARSAADGDDYTNDYSVTIPNVTADVYTVALNYVVTASA